MNFETLSKKIMGALHIRPVVGGLEVSDSILRFVIWNGRAWETFALRLPPNLISSGKIIDYSQFVAALQQLHDQITRGHKKKIVNVVVSLSSVNVYSQVFSLPVIEGENLEKAIQLNIQMVSPAESSQTYSGWQMLGEDQQAVRLEILSSFINREVVDEICRALKDSHFTVHSIESRALSLTRLIRDRQVGFDRTASYLALSLDSSGLEFLVIRRGQLYFHYFNSWQDLYGAEKQISKSAFEAAVIRNLHQVLNFYNSHWTEPLAGIFISSTALRDDIVRIIHENFNLIQLELQLDMPSQVNPDWFVCVGSGLRGISPQKQDQEISLLGLSAREEYLRSQLLSFLSFWSLLIPVSFSVLILVLIGTNIFFAQTEKRLKAEASYGNDQVQEIRELQSKVDNFNNIVQKISSVEVAESRAVLINHLHDIVAKNRIDVQRLKYNLPDLNVSMAGVAPTEEDLSAFSAAMNANPEFKQGFDIPVTQVKKESDGLHFSASFTWQPSAAP